MVPDERVRAECCFWWRMVNEKGQRVSGGGLEIERAEGIFYGGV